MVADARALLRSADPSSKKDNELFFVDKQGAGNVLPMRRPSLRSRCAPGQPACLR